MKKLSLKNAAAVAIFLALPACTKQTEVVPNNSKQSVASSPPAIAMGMSSRVKLNSNGICDGIGDDCTVLPVITIDTSGHGGTDTTAVDTSKLSDAAAGGAEVVRNVFTSATYQSVCDQLSAEQVAKLQSGNYVIEITSQTADHITFIAQEGSVSMDNFDFAVQLNVVQ